MHLVQTKNDHKTELWEKIMTGMDGTTTTETTRKKRVQLLIYRVTNLCTNVILKEPCQGNDQSFTTLPRLLPYSAAS